MANVTDISELLERVQSPDDAVRNEAERLLKQMEVESYSMHLIGLCATFTAEDKPLHIQRIAVIIFKNLLDSKEHDSKVRHDVAKRKMTVAQEAQIQRWLGLDPTIKAQIRGEILRALHHPAVDLARTVSMLIAKVASIDLPRGQWGELIPALLNNMAANVRAKSSVRQATLETLGYVCEELGNFQGFELSQEFINSILTAVVRGMLKEEKDDDVRLAATKALNNALEFAHTNFSNEQERTYIMHVICEGTVCPTSDEIRVASYECLIRICQSYYDHLPPYMSEIFKLTLHAIQADEEVVAKQAVELWCTLCDEELDLQEDMQRTVIDESIVLHNLVKQCYQMLVPVLLAQLTKQEEDQELDETAWTLSMAAGTCLELVALCVGNDVVPIVLNYVKLYLENRDGGESWRLREAATFALGSILDGTTTTDLVQYIAEKFEVLLAATRDPDPFVRNTTAWTLGRIFEFVAFGQKQAKILTSQNIDTVVRSLTAALNDEPHIANRVCYAVGQLFGCVHTVSAEKLTLSPYLASTIDALLNVAFKRVADRGMQTALQLSAFDVINGIIRGAPDDSIELVLQLVPVVLKKLQETMQSNVEDMERVPDIQGMLCGCLGVVLRRLEAGEDPSRSMDIHSADWTMETLLNLFQSKHAAVHEEAMLAVGSLTFAVKRQFSRYMTQFMPILHMGLRNHQEIQVCISTIGTLSNICQAVPESIGHYCDPIMEVLVSTLQSNEVNRDIKPHILSSFADIALAMGTTFGKYLSVVANILKSAIDLSVSESGTIDENFAEYNNELRKGILEAFSGILQGVGRGQAEKSLHQESQFIIDFLERVVSEAPRDEVITAVAVGLLGDIAYTLPSLTPLIKQKKWIDQFVRECVRSVFPRVKETGLWAAAVIANATQTTATSA